LKGHGFSRANNHPPIFRNQSTRRSRVTFNLPENIWVPHPRRVFVFAARVGKHGLQSAGFVSGHGFSRANNNPPFSEINPHGEAVIKAGSPPGSRL
jgi:hypothetical protein